MLLDMTMQKHALLHIIQVQN